MNSKKKIVAAISIAGVTATFLPWVHAPIVGSVSGAQGDGWFSFSFFSVVLILSLVGKRSEDFGRWKSVAISILSALSALLGVNKIYQISNLKTDSDNAMTEAILENVSIGFGVYLVILAAFATVACIAFFKEENE
jgi:hypothetical protein